MTAVSAVEVHKYNPEHVGSLQLATTMVKNARDFKAELAAGSATVQTPGMMDQDEAFLVVLVRRLMPRHPIRPSMAYAIQASMSLIYASTQCSSTLPFLRGLQVINLKWHL